MFSKCRIDVLQCLTYHSHFRVAPDVFKQYDNLGLLLPFGLQDVDPKCIEWMKAKLSLVRSFPQLPVMPMMPSRLWEGNSLSWPIRKSDLARFCSLFP